MCQNSGSGLQNAQIQKLVDLGMTEKVIKSVEYTVKKRVAKESRCPFAAARQMAANKEMPTSLEAAEESENIANIGAGVSAISKGSNEETESGCVYMDTLAIVTQITKKFFDRLSIEVKKVQSSSFYATLTQTTQPAHLVAVSVLMLVLFTVWPHISEQKSTTDEGQNVTGGSTDESGHKVATLAYLGLFATHFGSQIWMTFVSGLSLYFSVPRHTFGQVQQVLFPKHFAMNAMLSISMLIIFVKYFIGNWSLEIWVQLLALAISSVIELTIRLYLAPPMLRLMLEQYRMESVIGTGTEVGMLVQGDLAQCPRYQRIHKSFRRIHMTIAMGNMTVLLATCIHLYYLASKIQLAS